MKLPFIKLSIIVFMSSIMFLMGCKDDELSSSEQLAVDIKKIEAYIAKNDIQGVQETASGLHYVITSPGSGNNAIVGSTVVVHYTGKLLNERQFDSSIDRKTPFSFTVGEGQVISGWDEGLQLFNEGAKGVVFIPSSLGYGNTGASIIGANEVLIFDIELLDFVLLAPEQLAEDIVEIEQYISDNNINNVQKTTSGLHYTITTPGIGNNAVLGDSVTINYIGKLLNGKVFDTTLKDPFKFKLETGKYISGWVEGVQLYNLNSKGIIIMPSTLAYGKIGVNGLINPNEIIVFEVEILDIN